MSARLATLRTYEREHFTVEIAQHVEDVDSADTVAWDDPEAEREYVERIRSGDYPWYCLGVHVYARSERGPLREIGSAYLGCCDTLDVRALGVRDIAREAIQDARQLLEVVRWSPFGWLWRTGPRWLSR